MSTLSTLFSVINCVYIPFCGYLCIRDVYKWASRVVERDILKSIKMVRKTAVYRCVSELQIPKICISCYSKLYFKVGWGQWTPLELILLTSHIVISLIMNEPISEIRGRSKGCWKRDCCRKGCPHSSHNIINKNSSVSLHICTRKPRRGLAECHLENGNKQKSLKHFYSIIQYNKHTIQLIK